MTTQSTTLRQPKLFLRLLLCAIGGLTVCLPLRVSAQNLSLALAGLRTANSQGQFNGIQADSIGDLYLLLDQGDGIRILKTNPTASTLLAEAYLGSPGDTGLALAIDPSGNLYVTGTTTSGTLSATPAAAFPSAAPSTTTSFVAKFDSNLKPLFLTFTGSGRMSSMAIAATTSGVFITGSIFSSSLPVTPSAILQAPTFGSSQNGFVEKFDPTGTTLLYATYLTGANGDTSPTGIAADSSGSAYIAGYTTASGYPTLNALVPNILPNLPAATSGFLTKLTPNADGIVFSTFIPGQGITSIALDPTSQSLLLAGNIAIGQFPIAAVQSPVASVPYQTLLRLPLDGSTVLASTLVVPSTQSFVTPGPNGTAWVAGTLTLPLLPISALSSIGNTFAAHITQQNSIDQTARFGGLPTTKPTFASSPATLTALLSDASGQPTLVGAVTPQASISLIPTETYDLPLFNAPTATLPNALRDAIPVPANCILSLCPGSAAYLASLSNTNSPSLALSADPAPNLTLRNLGSVQAASLTLSASNFTLTTNCPSTLTPAAECSIALSGTGPGTITVQAANAPAQTTSIPAITTPQSPVVVSPKELDFGIQTSTSAAITRTITVTNLTPQPQTFTSKLDTSSRTLPYTVTESSSNCTLVNPTSKLLAPGATCNITVALTASTNPANDTLLQAQWLIGTQDVLLTGFTQAAALTLSASEIDFGTQDTGGIHLPRYLYLSNSSDSTVTHTHVASLPPFALTDRCPTLIAPRSVCQIEVDYVPTQTPSNDAVTLNLDQNLAALLTAQSLPNPATTGTTQNPNLTISATSLNFVNAVIVTTASSITQTVTLGNIGAQPFPLALALTGDFTEATNCPASLAANSTCTVVLTFTPTQPGPRQGLLAITAGSNSTAAGVTLTGTGTPILPSNNGMLDLGSVTVGQPVVQWFKISQPFNTLSVTTTGDFTAILVEDSGYGHGQPPSSAFSSNSTGTCINCWLGLQFLPNKAGGQTGTLTLTSTPSGKPYLLSLTGTGLALAGLTITPATQDFGSVPIGSTSASLLFTVTNLTSTTQAITLASPIVTGDFFITPSLATPCVGSLAPSASCEVAVAFTPANAGATTGALNIATSAGTATAALTGFGLPTAALSLNPTSLIFRSVPGPTATLQTVTLTNSGTTNLQIAAPTVSTANFLPTTTCATLIPHATCTISVAFFPSNATATDVLQIPTASNIDGTSTVTTYTIPLSGTYTTANAGLAITPNQATFGPTSTGTLGLTRQFTISNLTSKSLTLNLAVPHQFVLEGAPCAGLAPNASCSFNVSFLPLTNGDISGTLFVQANPSDSSSTLNAIGYLEGYGNGLSALAISGPLLPPNLVDFGQVTSGQTSLRTLTLTNQDSTSPLTIRRIATQWPFLSTTTCGQSLNPNQACTVTITYEPLHQLASGSNIPPVSSSDVGTLIIESDALSSPTLIELTGTAAPIFVASPANSAPLLSYTASQNSLNFPSTQVGNISLPQIVTLSNTGTTTLHILSLLASTDFTVTPACTTLLPGSSCDLTLAFTPQPGLAAITRIGSLEILTDSSNALDFLSLIGTATPAMLNVTPTSLDFGTVLLGSSSTLPVQISNTSSNPVTFNSLAAGGDYSASTGTCPLPGNTLPASSNCIAQITFTPTQLGDRTGTLSLGTSATSLPLNVSLHGTGIQSHLLISPTALHFGNIAVGASANLTLTLSNTGNAPITALALSASPGDFAITAPCALATLAPGAACSITVTFTPNSTGPRAEVLTLPSSDPTSPSLIQLDGTGIPNGTFTLTVDGASTSSATVLSGHPATYTLTLTPAGNYSGSVALTCTPIRAADYAFCSLLPSTLTLGGSIQTALVTLNTITSTAPPQSTSRFHPWGSTLLAFLAPCLFLFWNKPRFTHNIRNSILAVITLAALASASGCGGGGDPNLRYASPGTYQYQVTANSTSGTQITQTVTLNLTIQPR